MTRPVGGSLRTLVRVGEILGVAAAAGGSLAVAAVRTVGRPQERGRAAGTILSGALRRLGPAFTKAGQMLATREDVLPAAACAELRRALALGRPDGDPADPADPADPRRGVEIGSVARVERREIDGAAVAVKTVPAGTAERLERDLVLMSRLAGLLAVPARRSGPAIVAVVGEICASVRRQTDLRAEAATLARLARLEATLPVRLPTVLPGHSDAGRLVMTWLPGQHPGRRFSSDRAVAKKLVLVVYEMLFVTGVVHCDLHPGNWWELPDGRLAVVDAGFAYELDDEMRTHFAEFFLGMASDNAEVCATHALAASARPVPPERAAAFRADLEELIATTTGKTAGDFSLARFAARFFAIQRRHGAYSKAEFIFPFMALLSIEGQVKRLDPMINFQALAGRVVLRAVVNRARTGSSDRTPPGARTPR